MTRHQFDAYAALDSLRERYAGYLTDTFGIRSSELDARLREHWSAGGQDHYPLIGSPLIQAAFPFPASRTLAELGRTSPQERTGEHPLHPRTVEMLRGSLAFKLFTHQVEAIQAASMGRTTVLSAGTGSGKTEAFLVSMIDALHWAEERGEDDLDEPGVRADVARIDLMWSDLLRQYGGPMLFGKFSIADAFYAPVAARFRTYGVPLSAASQAYVNELLAVSSVAEWCQDALAEGRYLPLAEPYRSGR